MGRGLLVAPRRSIDRRRRFPVPEIQLTWHCPLGIGQPNASSRFDPHRVGGWRYDPLLTGDTRIIRPQKRKRSPTSPRGSLS